MKNGFGSDAVRSWKRRELLVLILYAICFYVVVIRRSLGLSRANLVGFVVGPSGLNWLTARFLGKEGFPALFGMLASFYVGTKLMIHIQEAISRDKPLMNLGLSLGLFDPMSEKD